MNIEELTRHAMSRMGQRAIEHNDLSLILLIGTAVEDGYLARVRDCEAAERHLKQLLDRVRRLKGKRIVLAGGRIITAYRAHPKTERRLLRRAERRALAR